MFRRLVGLDVDDPVWDYSAFSKNRDRLPAGDIAARCLAAVLAQPRAKRLLSIEHFSVDGTLEIVFADDLDDEAVLKAERTASSTAC